MNEKLIAASESGPSEAEPQELSWEARLYHQSQINRDLRSELKRHQAVLRDFLTLKESGVVQSLHTSEEIPSVSPLEDELAFARGESAGLRMRLNEQLRASLLAAASVSQHAGIKAMRLALAQATTLKEEAHAQFQALEAQAAELTRDIKHRELMMESMVAQLQVRDERIRALEASFKDPSLLEEALDKQALQEALLQLQEEVVALSEELTALKVSSDNARR